MHSVVACVVDMTYLVYDIYHIVPAVKWHHKQSRQRGTLALTGITECISNFAILPCVSHIATLRNALAAWCAEMLSTPSSRQVAEAHCNLLLHRDCAPACLLFADEPNIPTDDITAFLDQVAQAAPSHP